MQDDSPLIFAGTASQNLARGICHHLNLPVSPGEVLRFEEGNLFVRVLQNVRGREVYLVQTVGFPANDAFMELIFWIDALKRASAASVTAIIPYFSYAKGDKKDEPRVSIRARVCADAIEAAGADRVVTMDLHAPQVQGFFRIPVDDLYAIPALCSAISKLSLTQPVIVSPDVGFSKKARQYADWLGIPLAIAEKQRIDHQNQMVIHQIVGDIANRSVVIVDDFTVSGTTLAEVARKALASGARDVYAAVTHGMFNQQCMQRLDASPIRNLLVTDTIETQPVRYSPKVQIASVAPVFAEAIRRIHCRESISVLFQRPSTVAVQPCPPDTP
jgi:ribose-phosphate pyrophosphokinase